ncbi:hypothetical protein [Cryobacterium sp. PAMC25264]|uniref:hypothetical protein n=1 Tax=Cryobacterium sp. PAMC25264 TaxID=2861288 RepID=UPI001C638EDF|nr:hypothetical protein [Cryobacterium sp. PAMC25264]QYF74136.1 hypothetical protein KY500_02540 [Cryobacterium sp. PAMC25264]
MTPSKTFPVVPGDQIHFLESGLTFATSDNAATGQVARRGMTITITDDLIRASLDRNGDSWLQRVGDPSETRFAKGPWPENLSLFIPGTLEWELAREARRVAAHAIPDQRDRAAALRVLNEEFGPGPSGQTSTRYGSDPREQD